jgi:hypothetical protein
MPEYILDVAFFDGKLYALSRKKLLRLWGWFELQRQAKNPLVHRMHSWRHRRCRAHTTIHCW